MSRPPRPPNKKTPQKSQDRGGSARDLRRLSETRRVCRCKQDLRSQERHRVSKSEVSSCVCSVWREMTCGRLRRWDGSCLTSCRNPPPLRTYVLKSITSCTFEGLDALSFGCDITVRVVVVIDSGSAGDRGDQVLCCMLPGNKNDLKKKKTQTNMLLSIRKGLIQAQHLDRHGCVQLSVRSV